MTIFSKHIDLSKELSVRILSNRATACLLFEKTQKTFWNKVILNFAEIEFASKSFVDELNALINQQDEKTYSKENISEEVHKMEEFVHHSQNENP